jgi:hypothetical protein
MPFLRLRRPSLAIWLLVVIVGAGIALRTIGIGSVPFQHWDDVYTARSVLRYSPGPRTEFRLSLSSGPTDPVNPLTFVKSVHGPLTLIVGFVWMHLVALFRIPLDEGMWHLPFALLGSVLIATSYLLGSRLRSRRAGLIAAALVAVLPLHVAFSRISGEAHFILATGLQQACLLMWWRYLEHATKRAALATGVLLGLAILTDFFFVGLLITLGVMAFFHARTHTGAASVRTTLRPLGQWRIVLPALGPLLLQLALAGYTLMSHQPAGMFGRVLSQLRTEEAAAGGLDLGSPLANMIHGSNWLFVGVIITSIVLFALSRAYRDAGVTVALALPLVYLFPLLFLHRERLIGHYIPVLTGFCLFLACLVDHLSAVLVRRLIALGMVSILVATLLLSTLSMVYRIPVGSLFQSIPEHGAIGRDYGTKAAAWWLLHNTPSDALVFGDAFAQQDFAVGGYYYRRPMVGLSIPFPNMQASVQEALKAADKLDYLVLGIDNVAAFPASFMENWEVYAVVTVQQKPTLYIYGRRPYLASSPPQVLESTTLNEAYDRQYAVYPALLQR